MDLSKRVATLKARRRTAYQTHAKAVRSATARLDADLATIEGELEKLETWATDPPVLVRNTPGPPVQVYHSAVEPCGKINPIMVRQGRYDTMPLGEALAKGLRPCTACAFALRSGAA